MMKWYLEYKPKELTLGLNIYNTFFDKKSNLLYVNMSIVDGH